MLQSLLHVFKLEMRKEHVMLHRMDPSSQQLLGWSPFHFARESDTFLGNNTSEERCFVFPIK